MHNLVFRFLVFSQGQAQAERAHSVEPYQGCTDWVKPTVLRSTACVLGGTEVRVRDLHYEEVVRYFDVVKRTLPGVGSCHRIAGGRILYRSRSSGGRIFTTAERGAPSPLVGDAGAEEVLRRTGRYSFRPLSRARIDSWRCERALRSGVSWTYLALPNSDRSPSQG